MQGVNDGYKKRDEELRSMGLIGLVNSCWSWNVGAGCSLSIQFRVSCGFIVVRSRWWRSCLRGNKIQGFDIDASKSAVFDMSSFKLPLRQVYVP